MESQYKYICKLATQLSKTYNINFNDIMEQTIPYNRIDIMYLVLAILMNNGLLFQKKFNNYDWYIDKNDFSPFCIWYSNNESEGMEFISLPDEEAYDQEQAELIHILKEEYEEEQQRNHLQEIESLSKKAEIDGDLLLEFVNYFAEEDNIYSYVNEHKSILEDNVCQKSKIIPNPYADKVTYQLKDKEGNISGKKIMWMLRNKCAHNEYTINDNHILLRLKDSMLEMIDYDLFVILKTYLEELINTNTIKHLLKQKNYYTQVSTTIDESYILNENDVIKINEIVSMFILLLKEFYNSHQIEEAINADEIILNFNSYLNNIADFDNDVIEAIDNPNYETAQLSALFFMIFVLSSWDAVDISSINLDFINVYSKKSKIENLYEAIKAYEIKIKYLQEKSNNNTRIIEQINELNEKIRLTQGSIEYINSNENTIKHLRNAFAHGYYYFKDDIIYIYDYDNNQKQTYCANCKIIELLNFVLKKEVLESIYNLEKKSNSIRTKL